MNVSDNGRRPNAFNIEDATVTKANYRTAACFDREVPPGHPHVHPN
jgi:hypothetical protein